MEQASLERGIEILQGRTQVVRVMLWVYIASACMMLAGWGYVIATGLSQDFDSDNAVALGASFAAIAYALTSISCIVGVAMWIHRAHANLFAAGFDGLEFTPGWSIGWFFVPVACLFKPFQAMRELWNASHLQADRAAPADRHLKTWWGFWIAGIVVENIGARFSVDVSGIDLLGYALQIPAAWCLLQIVEAVTDAQSSQMTAAYAFA